ncbi:MAG: exodeoxyribonuclease III, partial [Thermodesulfobacteriota bacterium]
MKVASFNANSIRARLPIIVEWLREESPDLLCVQETKVVDSDFPAVAFEEVGYGAAFCGEKSYNGVAILSKHPLKDVSIGFAGVRSDGKDPAWENYAGENYDGTRIIKATVKGIPVVNTYVPQGSHPLSEKFRY